MKYYIDSREKALFCKYTQKFALFSLYCNICQDEEEDLCDEGHPRRSDEAIHRDEYDITDDVEDRYTGIDIHHPLLLSSRDQYVGIE